MNLFKLNTRDYIGIGGWLITSIIIGIIAEIIMIAKEYYQWKHYKLAKFEIEDVVRYSIIITIGTIININLMYRRKLSSHTSKDIVRCYK